MDDILKVAGGVLAKVAPMLASAFGGPLAGAATGAIISALGLAPDASKEAVAAAVAGATPDQLLALKRADAEFAIAMKKLDLDAAALAGKDLDSARNREVQVRDRTPAYLAYGLSGGFFGLLLFACLRGFPAENATLLNIMLGALGTAWTGAMSYYFGSSAGSQAKDRLLFNSVPAG